MYVNYRYGAAMLHYFVLLKNLKIFYNFVLMKSKITNHVCLCSGPGRTWICRTYSVSWRVGYREAKWCRVAVASCRVAWRVVAGAVGGMARVSRLTAGGASAARGALTRSVATPPRRPRAPKFFGNFARQVEMRDAASFLRLTDFAIGNRFLGINSKRQKYLLRNLNCTLQNNWLNKHYYRLLYGSFCFNFDHDEITSKSL